MIEEIKTVSLEESKAIPINVSRIGKSVNTILFYLREVILKRTT